MSISSLVLITRPEDAQAVADRAALLEGVEVYAVSEDGRVVVTVDNPDNHKASEALINLSNTEGVVNASLVYNYFEDEDSGDQVSETSGKEEAHDVIQA